MANKKLIAIVLIVAVIGGGIGVYMFLALPAPIFTTTVNVYGNAGENVGTFTVSLPNSQIQLTVEVTTNTGTYWITVHQGIHPITTEIYDTYGLPASGSVTSPWFDATGVCTLYLAGDHGDFSVIITVYARGVPFIV